MLPLKDPVLVEFAVRSTLTEVVEGLLSVEDASDVSDANALELEVLRDDDKVNEEWPRDDEAEDRLEKTVAAEDVILCDNRPPKVLFRVLLEYKLVVFRI